MTRGKSALGIVKKYYPQVRRVVDAKRSLSIAVTARDNRKSTKKSPNNCALANACEREYDGAIVSMTVAYLVQGDKALRFKVGESVAREIVSFDRHHDFAPGTYKLRAPTASTKLQPLGRKLRRDRKGGAAYGNHKQRIHRTTGIRSL